MCLLPVAPPPAPPHIQIIETAYAQAKEPLSMPGMIDQIASADGVSTTTARAIAWCESQYRQYDRSGNVLRGPDGYDVGIFQLRTIYQEAPAKKMSLDIYDAEENIRYGVHLLKTNGTAPWQSSSGCWKPLIKNPSLIPIE